MTKLAAIIFAVLLSSPALAQTSPNFSPGQVPTAGTWNSLFAAKQDYLGSPALPTGGGTMTGELITAATTATTSGLNLPPGTVPSAPVNGDMWMTTAGLFIRVAGTTIGPLGISVCSGCAVLSTANVFTALQTINLNVGTLPAAMTGDVLYLGGADTTIAREQITAFGAVPTISYATYAGTNASKTQVLSTTEIARWDAFAYNGAALSTSMAAVHVYAAENIAAGHQGSEVCIATTPIASVTIADFLCQQNDGGITIGSPTGGSKGAGTVNAAGNMFVNGTQLAAGGTVNAGTAGNLGYYATTSSAVSPITSVNLPSAGTLQLGIAGSTVGVLSLLNATSGSIKLQPPTGGLGSAVLTVPDFTDTLAVLGQTQTFSGALTFSNTVNFTSTVSVGGNAMTFPGGAATLASLTTADQTLTGGANVTPHNYGSPSGGTTTIDCGLSPLQFISPTAVVTIAAPANDGSCLLLVNSTSTPVFSGFTVTSNVGDAWVNGPYMAVSIFRILGVASYIQKAI